MRILKKYLYVGALIGAIVLAGCSISEEPEDQVQEKEDAPNGQAIEYNNLPEANKEEVVSEVPLELTKEQKEDYYKQYVEIVEEVMREYPDTTMEVVPFDEFKEEDWVEPEEFRQIAIDRTQLEFVVEKEVIYEN